jgi:hypothetical protein
MFLETEPPSNPGRIKGLANDVPLAELSILVDMQNRAEEVAEGRSRHRGEVRAVLFQSVRYFRLGHLLLPALRLAVLVFEE